MDKEIKKELRSLLNRVTRADYDDKEEEEAFDYYILDPTELITLKLELEKARKWDILLKRCNDIIKEG